MARKALLIGSQTDGLTGVGNDVSDMAESLALWGFEPERRVEDDASRAGILDAYERLIADAKPDDAIFIYYSGHGGTVRPPDYAKATRPRVAMQFIVPTDFALTTDDDFRGITAIELSVLLARLTERTPNVTVALDCCHAAQMSRDPEMRVKARTRPEPYDRIAAHIDGLSRKGLRTELWTPEGNRYAVRMVACAPDQSAHEYTNDDNHRTGIFTESLVRALAEAREVSATWATVMDRVQERVLSFISFQRPEAEGPARRLLFDVVEADPVSTLPVVSAGTGRVRLDGGPLLGVQIGDEFAIMPADSAGPDNATKLGDVLVDRIDATAAGGAVHWKSANTALPLGARAHRTKVTADPFPVHVPADDPRCAALAAEVSATPLLRLAAPDEQWQVEVRVDAAGHLNIWDRVGPLHNPVSTDLAGTTRIMRDLKRLAQAHGLRCLTEDPQYALDSPISVEFGLVENGVPKPLPNSGAVLYAGQHVYVKVRNEGQGTVYASLLDVGVSAKIALLNRAAPSGQQLDPGKEYVFGWNNFTQVLDGSPLMWPGHLDSGLSRPETIVALVTSEPQDCRVFEQEGVERAAPKGTRSPLEQMVDQIATGAVRDLLDDCGPAVRYAVRTVDFELFPVGPPHSETATFEVDERPSPSVRLLSPKGSTPTTVAVRLSDIVVHRNRALGDADIRLDAVVLTGDGTARPTYEARTQRFQNIGDGDRLPLDNMVIYHGPAVEYLDIAVWVTRDSTESLALSDLLKERLTDSDIQQALGQLTGLLVAAPHAAAAVAAVGASAIIINAAYHVLRKAVGDSIGLYRTTLLAHERFGAATHHNPHRVRAQDFSFAYTVEEITG